MGHLPEVEGAFQAAFQIATGSIIWRGLTPQECQPLQVICFITKYNYVAGCFFYFVCVCRWDTPGDGEGFRLGLGVELAAVDARDGDKSRGKKWRMIG